jgi:hypothetical protein
MVAAMTLGSTWPVDAEEPEKQEKKAPQTIKQSSPTAGPTNPAATQQDKAPAETSKGRNAGPASGPQKIPGPGGAATQTPLGTPPATTTPVANTLYDPTKPRTPDGKVVTPEFFKSKEEVAKDLANPGVPAPESSPNPANKVFERTGADALRDFPTTVAPGSGKNPSTTRQQQSELTGTGKVTGSDAVVTLSGNRGSVSWTVTDAKLTHETLTVKDKDATVVVDKDYGTKTTTTTVSWRTGDYAGQVWKQVNEGKWWRLATPNPETDTGDGNVPKGIAAEPPKKSPSEIKAERRRQVTDPTDDQRRQFERMRMEANVALKSAAEKRTAGRIDENPVGDGPVGATGNPKLGGGKGCLQVDCLPKGGRPVGGTGQATGSQSPKP